jgi:calcineurin-like phosphoesterase
VYDFFTGGNHTPANSELHAMLEDPAAPVVGPINMPDCPGQGWKYFETGVAYCLSHCLGATVGREVKIENPLKAIDDVLRSQQARPE